MSFERPLRLFAVLDVVERVIVAVYRTFLALLMLGIVSGTVWVIVTKPWGAGHQGEWFYFGVAVLLALGWTVTQYVQLTRRQQRGPQITLRSSRTGDREGWELQYGSPPEGGWESADSSRDNGIQLNLNGDVPVAFGTIARELLPDAHAVARLEAELASGADLDEACRAVQPAYADWNTLARWAYRNYVQMLLDAHRSGAADPRHDDPPHACDQGFGW